MSDQSVVVVGAGIIGACVAWALQRQGDHVVLLDRDEPGRGASYGNMASIAVTEFLPASRPEVWLNLPRWLLDPLGPVRIRPASIPRLLPWLTRYFLAGRPAKVRQLTRDGARLCSHALGDWQALLAEAGLRHLLSEEGCLSLYADEAELSAAGAHLALLKEYGFDYRLIGNEELRALEPDLSPRIRHAAVFPDSRTVADPHALVRGIIQDFERRGGRFARGEVAGFAADGRLTGLRLQGGGTLAAGRVVVCAGAYSGRLARLLGERLPVETERGYHTQLSAPAVSLKHALIWPARAFMVSPTAGGIRVGGTVEMASLEAPPDFRRATRLLAHARQALPGLNGEGGVPWMGHRPAMPDTLPVIGPSARMPGVFYATGHGHLGLTLAATTARAVAELLRGGTPPLDLAPYRADRY